MFVMLFGFPPFYVDPNRYYGQKEADAIYALIQKGFFPEVRKGYGPWFPRKITASEEARDLMSKLMESDRGKRLSAKEALQHAWITNGGPKQKPNALVQIKNLVKSEPNLEEDPKLTVETLQEFARFADNRRFKFAITALFRDKFQEMRPQHFQNLKKLFKQMDLDGNGKISYQEFEQGMLNLKDVNLNKQQITKMFKDLDMNNMGEIAFEEFLNAAVHDYLVASDERLYYCFRELDDDEDGKIRTAQLKQKIKELNPYNQADELLKIVDEADLDHNGFIDYEEFLRSLHPNFDDTPKWFWEIQKDVVKNKDKDQDNDKEKEKDKTNDGTNGNKLNNDEDDNKE